MKIFSLFAGLFLIGYAAGETVTIPAMVSGDSVNLRTGPSRHSDIIGQLPRGLAVRVVLTDGEWSAIVPPPGTAGWISRSYLADGVVIGDRVNLRAGPSVAYPSLFQLDEGQAVAVIEEEGEWTKIELPETVRLWVSARYLSTGSEPGLPGSLPDETAAQMPREPDGPAAEGPGFTPPPPPAPVAAAETLPRPSVIGDPGPRSYTGYIRELEQPLALSGREYEYELAADRHDPRPIAFLTGRTVDLAAYRFRRVRIWAETVESRPGHPALLEVKGAGFIW